MITDSGVQHRSPLSGSSNPSLILTHFSNIPSTSHMYPSASAVTVCCGKTAASLVLFVTLARGSFKFQNVSMMPSAQAARSSR